MPATRIREVKGVNRVVYDATSKPPGTTRYASRAMACANRSRVSVFSAWSRYDSSEPNGSNPPSWLIR